MNEIFFVEWGHKLAPCHFVFNNKKEAEKLLAFLQMNQGASSALGKITRMHVYSAASEIVKVD